MERTTVGLPKPSQTESIAPTRFLVIQLVGFKNHVSFIKLAHHLQPLPSLQLVHLLQPTHPPQPLRPPSLPPQLSLLPPHGNSAREKISLAALAEHPWFDMEQAPLGFTKPSQMELIALMRFLAIPFRELQKPVKFLNNFRIESTMLMKKLHIQKNMELFHFQT